MTSFFKTDIITFSAILLRTSHTPIGLRPGFLSGGINPHERKASMVWFPIRSVHSFLTTFANASRRSLLAVPKLFDASILRQPSASIPERSELPFVLLAALLLSSSLIDANWTGWTFSSDSLIKISSEVQLSADA